MTESGNNPEHSPAPLRLPPLSQDEIEALKLSPDADPNSTAETQQLSSGLSIDDLRKQAKINEAGRNEAFRDHFEFLAIASLYLVWIILVLIGLAWVYHLLAPIGWVRLPDEQVRQLQSIITGGILASIAGGHVKKRLND